MVSSSGNVRATVPPGKNRLRVWFAVSVFVGALAALSQLAEIPVRSALRGYDNTFNYLWLRSALVDGDWDFKNDLAQCDTLVPEQQTSALGLPLTSAGRIPNKYGIGWAVLSLPFYLVADGLVAAGRTLGLTTLARDGWNPVYQVCLQLGHLALAAWALFLATRVVAAWLGRRDDAAAGVMLVWAASPLLYYQTVNLSMSHGAAFFSVTLLAYALVRVEQITASGDVVDVAANAGSPSTGARWWLLAGAGWGLAVITRFQLGIFGLLAAWALLRHARARAVFPRAVAFFALGAGPLVFLQLFAWHRVYGAWWVFSYGAEGEAFHWSRPELFAVLVSPWHGLFYWHPFLVVASVGLLAWAGRRSGLALLLLALVALTIYCNAAWWCWWFASAFGGRSFDAALLPLMAGLAWLLQRAAPPWRRALLTLAIVAGAGNFYLLLLYRIGAISRSDPVTWREMLRAVENIPGSLHF